MTHIEELFTDRELLDALEARLIRSQKHPSLPYAILNYSELAQWSKAWNNVTTQCRGLIYNYVTGEVLARPWRKFHNWQESEVAEKIPIGPYTLSTKFDGSLGILYPVREDYQPFETQWRIASRGSFNSEQAVKGSQMFLPTAVKSNFAPRTGLTYLFEILYSSNRIVVDYAGFEGLVLLDVIDTATGLPDSAEFETCTWPHKADKIKVSESFNGTRLAARIKDTDEGYVIYWPFHDIRAKVKGETYLRLHRLMTGCSARTVWEALAKGDDLTEMIKDVPDEFYDFVLATEADLDAQYAHIEQECRDAFNEYMDTYGWSRFKDGDRKRFALAMKGTNSHLAVLFRLWDDQPYSDLIWKSIKPAATKPFWNLEEQAA